MKEYVGTAVNVNLFEAKGGDLKATAELILMVSEPQFETDGMGTVIKRHEMSAFRFAIQSKTLTHLIDALKGYLDEMEKLEARASLRLSVFVEA